MLRFTSEFGMGSGGSTALLSSSKLACLKLLEQQLLQILGINTFSVLQHLEQSRDLAVYSFLRTDVLISFGVI